MNKKILVLTTIMVLLLGIIAVIPVFAESAEDTYGKVEALSGTPTKEDDSLGNITIKFTKTEIDNLKWVKFDDGGENRGKNGWWLGFRVTAPITANLEKSTWTSDNGTTNNSFQSVVDDGQKYCSFWIPLDEEILKAHTSPWDAYKCQFTWKGESDDVIGTLNVTINIDPTSAVLNKDPENSSNEMIEVTVDGVKFTLAKGDSLNSLGKADAAKLEKLTKKDGHTFDGFFKSEGGKDVQVQMGDSLTEATTLKTKFTPIPVSNGGGQAPQQPAPEKDVTPKTGSVNQEVIFISLAIISLIGIVVIKKYSK